jgi:hypothetical protein
MKLLFTVSVVVCLVWSNLTASEYIAAKKPVVVDDTYPAGTVVTRGAPVERIPMVMPPGTVLDSSYYDWQRNGCLNKRVWVNSDGSVHATYMKSPDQAFASRGMYYYYANELGGAFSPLGDVATFRNGFGSLSAFPTTHELGAAAVITTHDFGAVESYAFVDAYQGIGAWTQLGTNPADSVVWPKPSVNSDGSITIVGTLMNNLLVSGIDHNVARDRAPDVPSGFSQTWTWMGGDSALVWSEMSMEFPAVASGDSGRVGIAIGDWAADMHFFESRNNGIGVMHNYLTSAFYDTIGVPSEPDSSATVFLPENNWDIVYRDAEPHIVWTGLQAASPPPLLYDFRTRILHWSPETGIDTVVVSRYQSAIPADTSFVNGGFNHASIDWPQIGTSPDGEVLFVVYVGFNPNDVDTLNNIGFGDIWGLYSTDNGETWSEPVNISNPGGMYPGTDDRYPSISPVNYEAAIEPGMDAYIVYQTDDTGGSFQQGEEGANLDYFMFTGVDFSGVGIGGKGGQTSSMPKAFSLHQNYPNPFNPSTTLSFEVADIDGEKHHVSLTVYDIRGRRVRGLIDSELESGSHQVVWNGRNDRGEVVTSGVYLYKLKSEEGTYTRKMTVLK